MVLGTGASSSCSKRGGATKCLYQARRHLRLAERSQSPDNRL
jgi:hypothetical protein